MSDPWAEGMRLKGPKIGFTLVEVVVSTALAAVVVAAVLTAFLHYRRALQSQEIQASVQQNLRAAMMTFSRDLSTAGYGFASIPEPQFPLWIKWATMPENPYVEDGGGVASDRITLAAAYQPITTLAAPAARNDAQILVHPSTARSLNTSSRSVIYISGCELARVTGVSGDTLSISTDPRVARGLRHAHPAGGSVELVQVFRYSIDTPDYAGDMPPCLKRENLGESDSYWFSDVVAAGVEDLQVRRQSGMVSVVLRGRAQELMTGYEDPTFGDEYYRASISNTVALRNR